MRSVRFMRPMRQLTSASLMLCLVAIASVGLAPIQALAQTFEQQIDQINVRERFGNLHIGVSAIDIDSGQPMCDYNHLPSNGSEPKAGRLFIPASNMKLLTSGVALHVLGTDHEYRTSISQSGNAIVITGAGDPALADPDLLDAVGVTLEDLINQIADGVVLHANAKESLTEVIIDDRIFAREPIHPAWPTDQLNRSYCAEVSGLNFYRNIVHLHVTPGRSTQSQPEVRTTPSASWIEVLNQTRPSTSQKSNGVYTYRDGDSTRFIARGQVRTGHNVEVTAHDSALIMGRLLADALLARGIKTADDAPLPVRYAMPNEPLKMDSNISKLPVLRTPISTVLQRCNKESENLYAESLGKLSGQVATQQPGSWSNAAAVMRMHIVKNVGSQLAADLVIDDCSGMSRSNRVSPRLLTEWLTSLTEDQAISDAMIASLPTVGEGTLSSRFRRTPLGNEVRAKSGYIRGVRTLSGYLIHPVTKRKVAFSVLVNGIPNSIGGSRIKRFHEEIIVLFDEWLTKEEAGKPAPTSLTPATVTQ